MFGGNVYLCLVFTATS